MENPRCSFDSFDALYKCSCGFYMCPKHYFSHQKEFKNHNIKNIKILVNKESRKILAGFISNIKQKFSNYANQFFLMSFEEKNISNNELEVLNTIFQDCNRIYLYLIKTESIPLQLFYSPIKYYLLNIPSKAKEYIKNFEFPELIPEDLSDFYKTNFVLQFIDFNYFKFEENKYINGWIYKDNFDEYNLIDLFEQIISQFINAFEYEMAYELTENMRNILDFVKMDSEITSFYEALSSIIYKLIEDKKYSKLHEEWIQLEYKFSKSKFEWVSVSFYEIFSDIFNTLNDSKLAYYCLQKVESISWKSDKKEEAINACLELGVMYYNNGEYKNAISCYKKSINLLKKFAKDNVRMITACNYELARAYCEVGKDKHIPKLLETIKSMKSLFVDKSYFYETIGWFYLEAHDFNKSILNSWKSIKMRKNNRRLYRLYLNLGSAFMEKNDMEKSCQMINNAKSSLGVLSLNDYSYKEI